MHKIYLFVNQRRTKRSFYCKEGLGDLFQVCSCWVITTNSDGGMCKDKPHVE